MLFPNLSRRDLLRSHDADLTRQDRSGPDLPQVPPVLQTKDCLQDC